MLKIETSDGEVFVGEGAVEVVQQMRNTQWGVPQVKREYMIDVVERVESMTGVLMDPDVENSMTAEDFIVYLCTAGVVRRADSVK